MHSLLWEHLQSAMRYLILLSGIGLISIILSLMRNDYLHVSFRAQGSALEQGLSIYDTPGIDIHSCLHIVEGVCYDCLSIVELVRVNIFSQL